MRKIQPAALTRRAFLQTTGALVGAAATGELLPGPAAAKPASPTTNALALVKDGQPTATIVVAVDAPPNVKIAAGEFAHYIQKMSGASLPVVNDGATPVGTLVLIGRSRLTDTIKGLDIPHGRTKNLREEGFIIWGQGNHLVLAGNDTEPYFGTRYAVCEMLHRLGVRWFMPGDFGEVVPALNTINVAPLSLRERPAFPMRDFWEHGRGTMDAERAEWKIHNKMNPVISQWFGVPSDGSIRDYLPNAQFQAHPDWFALQRDGTRDPHMACMTSEGMIGHFIERVKADARAGKRVSAFAPDDGAPRCYDPGCLKLASTFDGFGANDRDPEPESSTSQEWFYFVNRILEGVRGEFPDHSIATNGYANREFPPELPHFNEAHNLVIMFANITACTLHAYDDAHCWQMQRQAAMARRWCEVCDKVWMYNYNYTMLVHKGTLTPMVQRIRRTIPALRDWGLIGFNDQDESDWSLSGIATRLVRARLEWDTKVDVDEVLEDFAMRWYGRAVAPMRAYYGALENAFATTSAHGHEDVILPRIYTPQLMAQLDTAIRTAESLCQTPTEKQHLHLERLIYDHLREYVALQSAKAACDFPTALGHTERMLALKDQMNAITPFMGWAPYPVYYTDWEKKRMQGLLAKTAGAEGKLLAVLPAQARFRPDPSDDGRYSGWQRAGFDDAAWTTISTLNGWEAGGFQDQSGHSYKGVAWYRAQLEPLNLPTGKQVWLYTPAVVDEAWVWVNGHYAGHRPYQVPWSRPQALDLDISPFLVADKPNEITFRVLCNFDVFGASGIYERMFLYAKTPLEPVK